MLVSAMKTYRTIAVLVVTLVVSVLAQAQVVTSTPTFPSQTDTITVIFDASQGNRDLLGFTGDIYAHTGVITFLSTSATDWRFVKAQWTENKAECKLARIGVNLYRLSIPNPRTFYGVAGTEVIRQLAFVFRSSDGSRVGRAEDGADIYVDLYAPGTYLRTLEPTPGNRVVDSGQVVRIRAIASNNVPLMQIAANGVEIARVNNDTISATYTVERTAKIDVITYNELGGQIRDTFTLRVRPKVTYKPLPQGARDGANIINDTTAVVVLYAPGKSEIYAVGEFSDWKRTPEFFCYQTPDKQRWWTEIPIKRKGQTLWQWSYDDDRRISDPYAEQLCDPSDRFIESWRFPQLPQYPTGKTSGIISVINTQMDEYVWKNTAFVKPDARRLVVYELLVRDFTDKSSFQAVIDSLDYLKNLGVTAIELMPITEFEGNDSWGYNVSHQFAVDKYYGTKNDLKRLIDEAHGKGMAVILDIVLNHQFGQSPLVNLWGSVAGPTPENPYFNVTAKHPFNVGYDMNHESEATKQYVDRFLKFWITEFKFDGYRFDLSKGLTQFNSGSDAGLMSRYDASRIAILKRMMSATTSVDAGFYNILEHFADNAEEKELSDNGAILWANSNYAGSQAVMAYSNQDIASGMSAQRRGFGRHGLVGYVESHDEERTIYRAVNSGSTNPSHNTRDTSIALRRLEALMVKMLCIPGPKMLWQFNELGYPISINENGRLGRKPMGFPYLRDLRRRRVMQAVADMNQARKRHEAFAQMTATLQTVDPMKSILVRDASCDYIYLGNFDVVSRTVPIPFTRKGRWYEFATSTDINVYLDNNTITLLPGEYRLYSTQSFRGLATSVDDDVDVRDLSIYPNPADDVVVIDVPDRAMEIIVLDVLGSVVRRVDASIAGTSVNMPVDDLPAGSYSIVIRRDASTTIKPLLIRR
jgi:1,4-alpha-glucan branching enzyme